MNKWRRDVDELCRKFGAEPFIMEGDNENIKKMSIASPEKLSGEEQAAIARCIPVEVSCEFKVVPLEWKAHLNRVCAKFNVEPVIARREASSDAIKVLAFNCPRELTAAEKDSIMKPVPDGIEMEFNVAPKQATIGCLNTVLLLMGTKVDSCNYDTATRTLEVTGHGLTLNIPEQGAVNLGEILSVLPKGTWDRLSVSLQADGAIDSCKLTCDGLNLDLDVKHAKMPESDIMEGPEATGTYEAMDQRNRQREQPSKLTKPVDKKPERDICPTKDEITNLAIDLGNAQSIDDVLRLMGADPTQK